MSLLGRKDKQLIDTEQAVVDELLRSILAELQRMNRILIEVFEPLEDEASDD